MITKSSLYHVCRISQRLRHPTTHPTTISSPRELSGYATSPQPSISSHSEVDVLRQGANNYRQIIPHITTSQPLNRGLYMRDKYPTICIYN